ncbi:sugar transferase [Sphingopyxis sp. H050]|jgi:exopolysaccharide production protein ExoY|uniref:sugar transferase n=1 Tax=Sphingopyxis sp. H050 TaxID=1759072 RepID=UPI000A72ED1B|nr:sugar transferase [Sphingopyxis sp. H050]
MSLDSPMSMANLPRSSAEHFGDTVLGALHHPHRKAAASDSVLWDRDEAEEAIIRVFDFVSSLAAIILFLPLLVCLYAVIKLTDPGPVLFVQQRIGKGGENFPCMKFRSMAVDAEARLAALLASDENAAREWAADQKLRNDPRITAIGGFLRKTSLDELPQLFNILMGQMSVVGPRPIVAAEMPRYGRSFEHYCAVRPGLTGLWQISGRNDTSYDERVALDVRYVRTRNLHSNIQICARTIPAILGARGCY